MSSLYLCTKQISLVAPNLRDIFDLINLLLGATNLTSEDGKLIFQVIMTLATMEMMKMSKRIKMMIMVKKIKMIIMSNKIKMMIPVMLLMNN